MELEVPSGVLGQPVRVLASRPEASGGSTRWLWLLHGRGAAMADVSRLVDGLGDATTVVAPYAPWADGAAWWADSDLDGGLPLESALLYDVLPHLEACWGPPPDRADRLVGGYSMGGGAALRWAIAHDDLFGGAALVAPAAFADEPPLSSSARSSGAFGSEGRWFDPARWDALMRYQDLLSRRTRPYRRSRVAIIVGDQEEVQDYPGGRSSLTLEAARLHTHLRDAEAVESALRVVGAGHGDDFWLPAMTQALAVLATLDGQPAG